MSVGQRSGRGIKSRNISPTAGIPAFALNFNFANDAAFLAAKAAAGGSAVFEDGDTYYNTTSKVLGTYNSTTGMVAPGGSGIQNKFNAVVPPSNLNDSTQGYSIGSMWVDTAAQTQWVAISVTPSAALWKITTTGAAGGVATSGTVSDNQIARYDGTSTVTLQTGVALSYPTIADTGQITTFGLAARPTQDLVLELGDAGGLNTLFIKALGVVPPIAFLKSDGHLVLNQLRIRGGGVEAAPTIRDPNDAAVIELGSVASAVNRLKVTNGATSGVGVILEPTGPDTNIKLSLRSKGTGLSGFSTLELISASDVRMRLGDAAGLSTFFVENSALSPVLLFKSDGMLIVHQLRLRGGAGFTWPGIHDLNDNEVVSFPATPVASAVNQPHLIPSAASTPVTYTAEGNDSSVSVNVTAKGSGIVSLVAPSGTNIRAVLGGAVGTNSFIWTNISGTPQAFITDLGVMNAAGFTNGNWTNKGVIVAGPGGTSFTTPPLGAGHIPIGEFAAVGSLDAFTGPSGYLKNVYGGLGIDTSTAASDGFVEIRTGVTAVIRTNYTFSGTPGAGENLAAGYATGSRIIDPTAGNEFVKVSESAGVAVWKKTTP